jgi:23S rRNA pseudouridine955/2504/2580 synthase
MDKKPTNSVKYLTIDPDFSDQRIDNFLITRLKGVPKTHIYRILRKGEVRVNKKRIQPSYRLQAGDQVRIPPVKLADPNKPVQPSNSLMETLKSRVLYEDKLLLIMNKPSGIAVHGGSGVKLGLVEALRSIYPKSPHLELAHRLDSDTSGCLILAKKRSALKELHELLRLGKMRKLYYALTKGSWKKSELRVEAPLQKNQLSGGERIVKVQKDGKPSLTVFRPIKSFAEGMLVEAELFTGRTHQIRVHAQYRGHPIAGDEKYGDRDFNKLMKQQGLDRLFLHAHTIEFVLPSTGQHVKVSAPLDSDLEDLINSLK